MGEKEYLHDFNTRCGQPEAVRRRVRVEVLAGERCDGFGGADGSARDEAEHDETHTERTTHPPKVAHDPLEALDHAAYRKREALADGVDGRAAGWLGYEDGVDRRLHLRDFRARILTTSLTTVLCERRLRWWSSRRWRRSSACSQSTGDGGAASAGGALAGWREGCRPICPRRQRDDVRARHEHAAPPLRATRHTPPSTKS